MNRWPCRCSLCRSRRTLAQHPERYDDPAARACPCGGEYRADNHRKRLEHKRTNCHCDGYPWSIRNGPHRRGSPKCKFAGPVVEPEPAIIPGNAADYPF